MMWVIGAIALIGVVAAAGLQFAIARNGPAVLSTVDRWLGDAGSAQRAATISIGDDAAQKLVVWNSADQTSGSEPLPVLLFAHGGSWRSGDPTDYGFVGRSFVPKGFVVVLAGYRLHPHAVYPAMLEDTAAAIAWTHAEIAQYGGDPDRIILAGHSAGAYNVVQSALEEQWLGREGLATSDIVGVVGLAGPYDFFPFDSDSTRASFGDASNPEATQPINHVREDAPPMLLIHGERDDLVKIRNSKALTSALTAKGARVELVTYPEMSHNDPLISLAAPWRNSRDVDDLIAEFAQNLAPAAKTSVPVQRETR